MNQIITILALSTLLVTTAFAQHTWTLDQCIQHAKQNNAGLKQAEIATKQAELTEKLQRFSRWPTINGNINGGMNFGRTIDPTSNDFVNRQVAFNGLELTASATVYNGGKIKHAIEQSKYSVAFNKAQADAQFQNLALEITKAYLNILLAKEQLTTAKKQVLQSERHLVQIDKRIAAGLIPESDRLEVVAQIARNEQTLSTSQNTLDRNDLLLKIYLEVAPHFPLSIELPDLSTSRTLIENTPRFSEIYEQALETQAVIKAGEFQTKSAALNIPIAKADLLPSINVAGRVNSRYSNVFDFRDAHYFNQLDNNLGQSIAIQVSIPIYNNHSTSIAIERARLGIIEAEIQQNQNKQQLQSQIQTVLSDAKGAKTSLQAAQKTVAAAQASYDNALVKYQLGTINTLEVTTTKTNLDTAELDLVRAKYDYLFRLKIIDFYLGRGLDL